MGEHTNTHTSNIHNVESVRADTRVLGFRGGGKAERRLFWESTSVCSRCASPTSSPPPHLCVCLCVCVCLALQLSHRHYGVWYPRHRRCCQSLTVFLRGLRPSAVTRGRERNTNKESAPQLPFWLRAHYVQPTLPLVRHDRRCFPYVTCLCLVDADSAVMQKNGTAYHPVHALSLPPNTPENIHVPATTVEATAKKERHDGRPRPPPRRAHTEALCMRVRFSPPPLSFCSQHRFMGRCRRSGGFTDLP